ncbi:hypothetical protein ATG66_3732 [Vibrio sp. ES.051]|uniref:DNA repair protein n=1 Tax=Vibrio sp. ES.051 TaxID=1761909 RepID=UPI000BF72CB6|nr:DNA repair protein [Vibrio sp. ES.051]PFG45446.1 hypothetical protein ATG66_3732 [Vibrio sp. ES.051]
MNQNKDYEITSFSSEDIIKKLQGCSPLQASKILLDVELHDQKDSLKVLEDIEKEINQSQSGIGDALIQPIILSVCDGFVRSSKLDLSKNGLTATRLVNEIQHFRYDEAPERVDDARLEKERLNSHSDNQSAQRGKYDRKTLEDKGRMTGRKDSYLNRYMEGQTRVYSELEVNPNGVRKALRKRSSDYNKSRKNNGINTAPSEMNVDHQVPLKHAFDAYGSSRGLTNDDLKDALNQDDNYKVISGTLNTSKGDMSWSDYTDWVNQEKQRIEQKKGEGKKLSQNEKDWIKHAPSDETLNKSLKADQVATQSIEKKLNDSVVKNLKKDSTLSMKLGDESYKQAKNELEQKGIGELIILIIKPIFFELTDSLRNGVLSGFETNSKLEAIKARFHRAYKYVINNIKSIGFHVLKDALKNFIKYFINAVIELFVGMLKSALKILTEGFSAIIQSIKILMSDSTQAQKADAITKLLATTIVTYLSFAFETSLGSYIANIPIIGEHLKEATSIMISGIGSAIVVWMIDQADIFSTKADLRQKRVKEVFELRIRQIKENTDAFENASIERLAKERLQFRQLNEKLNDAVKNNRNVNKEVESIADFMHIDLKIKSSDDFMALLENHSTLEIV